MRVFLALALMCALLSGCGAAYTWIRRSAQAQIACISGMLLDPGRGCWASRRVGDEVWQAGWP